jgi:prepilin-type N-terminal cleavage/methylation domain-containing protein
VVRARTNGTSAGGAGGFTLVELILTLVVVGLILALAVPNLDKLTPKYALRAAAREVGSTIDFARGSAAGKGRRYAIRYDCSNGAYGLYGPPGEEDAQLEGPWRLAIVGRMRFLPSGVHFRRILSQTGEAVERGEAWVRFDPLSLEGSHIVYLENDNGKRFSVKYNALLGSSDFAETWVEFETGAER